MMSTRILISTKENPKIKLQAEQYIAFCQLMVQPAPGPSGTAVAQQKPPADAASQKGAPQQPVLPLPAPSAPAPVIPLPSLPEDDVLPPAIAHAPVRKATKAKRTMKPKARKSA